MILFVFEGEAPERIIVDSLSRHILGERHAIQCVFGADIYQLYQKLQGDDGFAVDIVTLLKETKWKTAEMLKDYARDSFSEVYLFFDYDAHATGADDAKIEEMVAFFGEETENGKLYISYPMAEAIRQYNGMEEFRGCVTKCKRRNCPRIQDTAVCRACQEEPSYKEYVRKQYRCFYNIGQYTSVVWRELIAAHLCKANYLVNDRFELPTTLLPQQSIFAKQLADYVSRPCPEVAVLSAFPLYVLDYLGCQRTLAKLQQKE